MEMVVLIGSVLNRAPIVIVLKSNVSGYTIAFEIEGLTSLVVMLCSTFVYFETRRGRYIISRTSVGNLIKGESCPSIGKLVKDESYSVATSLADDGEADRLILTSVIEAVSGQNYYW